MSQLRLLLDQMIDVTVADVLRDAGHDVLRTADVGMTREDDATVLGGERGVKRTDGWAYEYPAPLLARRRAAKAAPLLASRSRKSEIGDPCSRCQDQSKCALPISDLREPRLRVLGPSSAGARVVSSSLLGRTIVECGFGSASRNVRKVDSFGHSVRVHRMVLVSDE